MEEISRSQGISVWVGPAGRGSSYHMGIGGVDKDTHASRLCSRSGRNPAGGGGATLIFCQGPRVVGFVGGARPLDWEGATCIDPGRPWLHFPFA